MLLLGISIVLLLIQACVIWFDTYILEYVSHVRQSFCHLKICLACVYYSTPKIQSLYLYGFQGFTHPVRAHFLEDVLEMTGYKLTSFNQVDDYGQDKLWKTQKQLMPRKRKNQITTLVEVRQRGLFVCNVSYTFEEHNLTLLVVDLFSIGVISQSC